MKKKIKDILIILLTLFSLGCIVYALVKQCLLSYELYGVILDARYLFILDDSSWWYLGGFGLIPAYLLLDY